MLRLRSIFHSKNTFTQISTIVPMTGRIFSHRKFWELIDKSSEKLPPVDKVEKIEYKTPWHYIGRAEDEIANGDVMQCSEKLFAGVKKALRIYINHLLIQQGHVAIKDDDDKWNQEKYQQICRLIHREVKDKIIIDGWRAAIDLHKDGWNADKLEMEDVKLDIPKIKKCIKAIEDLPNVKMQDPAGLALKILKEFYVDDFDPDLKAERLKTSDYFKHLEKGDIFKALEQAGIGVKWTHNERKEVVEAFNKDSGGKVNIPLRTPLGMAMLNWCQNAICLPFPWLQRRFGFWPSKMKLMGTKNCTEEGGAKIIGNVLSVVEQISSPKPVKRAEMKPLGPKQKKKKIDPEKEKIGPEEEKPIGTEEEKPIGTEEEKPIGTEEEKPIGTEEEKPIGTEEAKPIGTEVEKLISK